MSRSARYALAIVPMLLALTMPSIIFGGAPTRTRVHRGVVHAMAPAGSWSVVGVGGLERPVGLIGVARAQGTLHVAWVRRTGGNSYDLMHTAIAPRGTVVRPTPIVTGWAGLGDAALVSQGDQLLAFFDGERTTSTTEPYFGLNLATSTTAGAGWALYGSGSVYSQEYAYARAPSVTLFGATTIQTWNGLNGQVVHVGLDPNSSVSYYGPAVCCLLDQNIVSDRGQVWIAWCAQNEAPAGRWVQQIEPSTGRVVGLATKLPGSEAPLCESSGREPLVVRAGGGTYLADAAGANGTKVELWRVGSTRPLTVTAGSDAHSRVALAAAPDGRLWVAWRTFHGADLIHLRRSNRSVSRFGAEVGVAPPRGAVEASHIDLGAQSDRVDILASFGFASVSENTLFHTQAFPGLTLSAHGAKKTASFVVSDAGDPVANATIRVSGKTLHTNLRGRASTALLPGAYKAVVSKPNYAGASAKVRILGRRR